MSDVLRRADERRGEAQRVVEALKLFQRWSVYSRPVLVGSVAYDLVVAADIDMEIYCAQPQIKEGFAVIAPLALEPGVWKVRFSNELQGPNRGLYWQLRYRPPASLRQEVWKIDMWLLDEDHPGPRSADLVEPMRKVLTPETRAAILQIKEATLGHARVRGIDVYRAVLDDGIRTSEDFAAWFAAHGPSGLTAWLPRTA